MAETQQKRPRPEGPEADDSNPKRQKPYSNILSLLDEEEGDEEEQQNHDLSAIFTTLEREISFPSAFDFEYPPLAEEDEQKTSSGEEDDESVRSVMRHLLEASDDELGIPNTDEHEYCNNVCEVGSDESFDFPFGFADDGLWELEDVAANYYTLLQSELFM